MIEKIKALVLRAADFKENDKLLLLYCGEYGKITASIRGVKKPGAKLKFAAEPFCFGEFMLSSRNFIRIVLEAAFFSSNALRVFNASNKSCGSD